MKRFEHLVEIPLEVAPAAPLEAYLVPPRVDEKPQGNRAQRRAELKRRRLRHKQWGTP